jgi:SAM-dependent methyltransferase
VSVEAVHEPARRGLLDSARRGLLSSARRLLAEPRARGLDVDGVDLSLAHREILRSKPQTRRLFARFYEECLAQDERWFAGVQGGRWELGSGAGFMGELHPEVVTSDVKPLPFVKVTCGAEALPTGPETLRAVYLVNVFHHLPDPRAFFREMLRVLKPGGGVVMIEPWHGPVASALFKRLHASEGFEKDQPRWEAEDGAGPMSRANQALSHVVFRRDRAIFEAEFPQLEICLERPHSHLSYLLSGGVNFRSLAPAAASGAIEAVERALTPVAPLVALQQTIVLRKRRSA